MPLAADGLRRYDMLECNRKELEEAPHAVVVHLPTCNPQSVPSEFFYDSSSSESTAERLRS